MAHYGRLEYWEERYSRDESDFDWYQRWRGLKDVIVQFVTPTQQILNIGCGNSRLSAEMYEDGFVHINNVDSSTEVIAKMKEKYRDKLPTMQYITMDARYLNFEDSSIDAVIDKATLDSVLCGDNSTANCLKVLNEVYRVLSPNGVFISVSHRPPSHRLQYLENPLFRWEITMHQVQKPPMGEPQPDDGSSVHYIYCCKKSTFSAS